MMKGSSYELCVTVKKHVIIFSHYLFVVEKNNLFAANKALGVKSTGGCSTVMTLVLNKWVVDYKNKLLKIDFEF